MSNMVTMTVEELSSIVVNVGKTIWKDLIFPTPQSRTPLEQIDNHMKSQEKMLLSQEDQLCSQASVIQAQAREIDRLSKLLAESERTIERMNARIRDLELQAF